MTSFVILVTFDLEPGALSRFLELVCTNARQSLEIEPGCEIFDVLLPSGTENRVVLYERYVDQAGFDAHCRSPHFIEFDVASRPLVRDKSFVGFADAMLADELSRSYGASRQ